MGSLDDVNEISMKKQPETDGDDEQDDSFGTIRWEIDKDSITKEGILSPSIEVRGIPWAIVVGKTDAHLSIYLVPENGFCGEKYQATMEYKLINHKNDEKTETVKFVNELDSESDSGFEKFFNWKVAIDEEKGYIKGNKLTVQITFWLSDIIEFRVGDAIPTVPSGGCIVSSSANDMFGMIRWEVRADFISDERSYSAKINVGGMPWSLCVTPYDGNLAAYLCNQGIPSEGKQIVDAQYEIKLINHEDDAKTIIHKEGTTIRTNEMVGARCLAKLNNVVDDGKGFIKDNKLTLQIRFWLSNIRSDDDSSDPEANIDFVNSGSMRREFYVELISNQRFLSAPIYVAGVPWRIVVSTTENKQHLVAHIDCNLLGDYVMDRINDMETHFIFINQEDEEKSITQKSGRFNWNYVIDYEKGFLKNGRFIIEAEFTLIGVVGWRNLPKINFKDPIDSIHHDVVLVVDNHKFHVNKQLLSIHSPVFDRMFFGDFKENNQKEIKIEDVNSKEFSMFLQAIHPPFGIWVMDERESEVLLKLADRFDIAWLLDKCEKYLITTDDWHDIPLKARLAREYRLSTLQGLIDGNMLPVQDGFSFANIGPRELRQIDFLDPNESSHDIAFVIKGEKVYANEKILSIHCKYFLNKFDTEWKNQNEIELKDISSKEFLRLLNVIHPPYKITDENVDNVLKLGEKFDIDWIMDKCEQHLVMYSDLPLGTKMMLAARHRLFILQIRCFDQLKTLEDVKDLKKSKHFKNFSDKIHRALLKKVLSF